MTSGSIAIFIAGGAFFFSVFPVFASTLGDDIDVTGKLTVGTNLGIGTLSPNAPLTINANTGPIPTVPLGTLMHLTGANSTPNRFLFDTFNNASVMGFRRANGTGATPTVVTADNQMGLIAFGGYDGAVFGGGYVQIIGSAAETWSTSAHGSYLSFSTTLRGAGGAIGERVRITDAGFVGIGTTIPTGKLDVNDNRIRIENPKTPVSAGDACNRGEIAWDTNYIYTCIAANTWKRAALSAW